MYDKKRKPYFSRGGEIELFYKFHNNTILIKFQQKRPSPEYSVCKINAFSLVLHN